MVSFLVVWMAASLILIYIGPLLFWSSSLGFSIPFAFTLGAVVALLFYISQQVRRLNDLEERIKQLEETFKPE